MPLTNEQRPDPDELLARLQELENKNQRGKLRIYFGSSAGVGKTFAMLEAARKAREAEPAILIGWIETHGRQETESLTQHLELLPRKIINYHGKPLQEFDLDAALAKKPAVLLVDELAHTNLTGCRHPKRWQDVEELLNNGINVWTTLNVQHLESLNDVVSGITGIRVMETLPDKVFNQADEVVLVDVPVEELLNRLKAGKVYLPHQAQRAANNFFRKGNLIALREITLRRTADRLERDVQTYKQTQSITSVWKTEGAILACINENAAIAEQVIRRTVRLAGQMSVNWYTVYVETPELQRLPPQRRERILTVLKLAEQLGANTAILAGEDIARTIVEYAHEHNLATVVVGHTRHSFYWFWRPPISHRLARLSPELDLLQVGFTTTRSLTTPTRFTSELEPKKSVVKTISAIALAVLASLATTAITASLLNIGLDLVNLILLHLLTVVLIAVKLGRQPAIVATLLNVATFNFFLVPPQFSFAVNDVQFLLTFAVMMMVGLITSQLTSNLRFQAHISAHREKRANTLFELARDLSGALKVEQIVEISTNVIKSTFAGQLVLLLPDRQEKLISPDTSNTFSGLDMGIAQWAFHQNEPAGFATNTLPANPFRYFPLRAPVRVRGILAVRPHQPHWLLVPEQVRQLETLASVIAIALERVHFVEVAQEMVIQIESERLRNSLLSVLSHDLRTPLTALVGLAESLALSQTQFSESQQELVTAINQTTLRMMNLVNNLLDMARIEEGKLKLHCELQVLEEMIGSAIRAVRSLLGQRTIRVNLAHDFPLIPCDAVLLERVLINLLENAAKYTPPTTLIEINARCLANSVEVNIIDNGEGIPTGQEEAIFEKFTRGVSESATSGVGLGLTICRAIIQAHRGKITARNHPQGGAIFTFTLPLPETNDVSCNDVDHFIS